jgi:predicted permease
MTMPRLPGLRRYIRLPHSSPKQIDRELDDELRFHLEMRSKELQDAGLPPATADREAHRRFGNVADAREYCRAQDRQREGHRRWTAVLDEAWQDAIIAVRQLRHRPLFAIAALLTLAFGIGANTAIYTLVNAYLIRPFPFPNDDRIAQIVAGPSREFNPNGPRLSDVDWRQVESTFDGVVAWDLDGFTVIEGGEPEYVDGAWVNPGYFDILGVRTAFGRGFSADDYRPDAHGALISHSLWLHRFGGDAAVVGKTVRMHSTDRPANAEIVTIVGVMPASTWHLNRFTDVLRPLTNGRMPSLARLRPGMSLPEAERRLTAAVRAQLPRSTDPAWHMSLTTLREEYTHDVRPMLLTIGFAGVLLLLLTCANVAGLIAARSAGRRREMGLRAALGAGRGRLVRQLLVEAAVLTTIAGAIGVALTQFGIRVVSETVQRQLGVTVPGGDANLRVDGTVLAVALVTSVLVVILIGARNAFVGSRSDLASALRLPGAGAGAAGRQSRTRMLVAQIALAFALLVGAGLTLRSAAAMSSLALGFEPAGVTRAHVLFPRTRYAEPTDRARAMTTVLDRIASDPTIAAAATVFPDPFRPAEAAPIAKEGATAADASQLPRAMPHTISSRYFDVMRVPILSGRTFGPVDAGGPPTAIVSDGLAARLWPGQSPIGQRIRIADATDWRTVVGVVRDVRKTITGELLPDVYVPFDQSPRAYTGIVARTRGDSNGASAIRRGLASVDAALAPSDVVPLAEVFGNESARPRALAALLTGFASFALVLAAFGLGGAMANLIAQRQRELAVRMAVGATSSDVLRLLLGDSGRVIAAGLAVGAALAYALSRVLANQLFGITSSDPSTYAVVAIVLAAIGMLAAALPGMRVTRIDPASVLRDG